MTVNPAGRNGAAPARLRCYTDCSRMPTSRPRHTLTETDELRDALDRAMETFPEARSRKALLHELIRLGGEEVQRRQEARREHDAARRARLEQLAEISTGDRPVLDFDLLARVRHDELA